MSEKHRVLPSWMAKREEKEKKESLKSRKQRKAARAAFYCMNEKELVEAAVSYLTNGACEDAALPTRQQVEEHKAKHTTKNWEKPTSSTTAKLVTEISEASSDCGDDLDETYVSETDLDITEIETVPYTKSHQHPGSEPQRSGPAQDHGRLMTADVETKKSKEQPQMRAAATEDDDSLQLVREIFFT